MIISSIEKIAEDIGFDISNSNDKVQADLFNGLGKGFRLYSERKLHMQLSYLSNNLNSDAEKLILELSEYIKIKQDKK